MPENTLVSVPITGMIALMNMANLILPEARNLVREGEVSPITAFNAAIAFDMVAEALDAFTGSDEWLEEAV